MLPVSPNEPKERPDAATETRCDVCEGRGWNVNVPSQTMHPCSRCNGNGALATSAPSADPDPRRLALIRLLNMLTLNQVEALGEDDMRLIFGKVGDVQVEEHLRAYGKPGSHVTMTVPERTVTVRLHKDLGTTADPLQKIATEAGR